MCPGSVPHKSAWTTPFMHCATCGNHQQCLQLPSANKCPGEEKKLLHVFLPRAPLQPDHLQGGPKRVVWTVSCGSHAGSIPGTTHCPGGSLAVRGAAAIVLLERWRRGRLLRGASSLCLVSLEPAFAKAAAKSPARTSLWPSLRNPSTSAT